MMSVWCIIQKREEVLDKIEKYLDFLVLNCFKCNRCWHCRVTEKLQREAASKGVNTFNSDIDWWSIDWYVDENWENMHKL